MQSTQAIRMNKDKMSFDLIRKVRPVLPAKNYQISKFFYFDAGFIVKQLGEGIAEVCLGTHSFLLRDISHKESAENFIISVSISDLAKFWAHFPGFKLQLKYDIPMPIEPRNEPWGQRVAYMKDPSGIEWHFVQEESPNSPC